MSRIAVVTQVTWLLLAAWAVILHSARLAGAARPTIAAASDLTTVAQVVFSLISLTLIRRASSLSPPGTPQLGKATNQQCPPWLEDYKRFHRTTRGQPHATYLLFGPCSPEDKCTGIGDRVRTSMAMLRLAYIHQKVLLISWDHIAPVTDFLRPAAINWEYDTALQNELRNLTSVFDTGVTLMENHVFLDLVLKRKRLEEFQQTKLVKTVGVRDFALRLDGQSNEDLERLGYLQLGRCLFDFLFTIHPDIVDKAQQELRKLYGPTPHPFVAWHWRSGGLVGERVLLRSSTTHVLGTSRLHQMIAAVQCAHDMAATQHLAPLHSRPLLLVTDHNLIRQWVAAGELRSVVTRNTTAVHIARSGSVTYEDVVNNWVEVAMLSQAQCLLVSHSGFSWVAAFLGRMTCFMDIRECLTAQRRRFEGLEV